MFALEAQVRCGHRARVGMFPETRWTQLAKATLHGEPEARAALEHFCAAYREPIRRFICWRGATEVEAEDLTHDFLLHVMEHSMLRRARQDRGRFRSYLLGALIRFLRDARVRQQATRRGNGAAHVSLDEGDVTDPAVPNEIALTFDREWAITILANALNALERHYAGDPRFEVLRRFLPGAVTTLSYEEAAMRLNISVAALKSEVHRARQRMRTGVLEEIAATVATPHEVQEEFRHLQTVLMSRSQQFTNPQKLSSPGS